MSDVERCNMSSDELLQDAFAEGYSAGWEFHLGNGTKIDNPYDYVKQAELFDQWQRGFDQCGEDS